MDKIKSISSKFRVFFKIAFFFVPVINLGIWIFYERLPSEISVTLLPHSLNLSRININPTTKTLACIVCMLQVFVILYAFNLLVKLFKNYEQGIIFALSNVICYRKLGYSVFAWVISNKIVDALISLILTFQNPIGQRQIVIGFASMDLLALAVGGVVILIAWIMNEGYKLNEEQALTI